MKILGIMIFAFLVIVLVNSWIIKYPKINLPFEVVTHKVFLDIKIGDMEPKRIHLVLFGNTMPKMTENFRALCTGEKGVNKNNVTLHYKGTEIRRIQRYSWIEGGDLLKNDNVKGVSIYGEPFRADSYNLGHNGLGYLGMRQGSLDTDQRDNKFTSIFYIITRRIDLKDDLDAVFGKVFKEDERLWLRNQTRYLGNSHGEPVQDLGYKKIVNPKIVIVDSGELPLDGTETEELNPEYYRFRKDDL